MAQVPHPALPMSPIYQGLIGTSSTSCVAIVANVANVANVTNLSGSDWHNVRAAGVGTVASASETVHKDQKTELEDQSSVTSPNMDHGA